MKNFFKIFFTFLALFVLVNILPQANTYSDVQAANYIQNDYQKVVLVSNNFMGGEIFAGKLKTSPDFIKHTDCVDNLYFTNSLLTKNYVSTNSTLIHNTSALFKNDISIRAP